MKLITYWAVLLLLFSNYAQAEKPQFDNISKDDLDKISKEFAANFVHSSVSPANSLGDFFGIEIGVIGGITRTPEIEALVKEQNPNTEVAALPHAGALLAVSIPFGITGEVVIFPETEASDVSLEYLAMAGKWTMTNVMFTSLPFDLALKGHFSNGKVGFAQTINNSSTANTDVTSTIEIDSTNMGVQLQVSKEFFIFVPYAGIGFVKHDTDTSIAAASDATIFDSSFSSSQSANSTDSSIHYTLGLQIDLFFIHLATEMFGAYGTTGANAKFSLAF